MHPEAMAALQRSVREFVDFYVGRHAAPEPAPQVPPVFGELQAKAEETMEQFHYADKDGRYQDFPSLCAAENVEFRRLVLRWRDERRYQEHFSDQGIQSIRHIQVGDIAWLRGVLESDLPHQAEPHNIIAGDSTAADFIRRLAGSLGTTVLEATSLINARELTLARNIIVSEVIPTACDRRRIEALYAGQIADQSLARAGEMLYVFRGKGGTGKTMSLLHNAWRLHHRDGLRVLILTYNKALRADLARQLTLMGVGEESGLAVQTVYSFLRRLYIELCYLEGGVREDDPAFFRRMDDIGPEALRDLKGFDAADLERFRASNDEFAWDLICVDEGQDWPSVERDLLGVLYGYRRLIVADGIDQMVRGREYCDWMAGLTRGSDYKIIPLERSKRMRANLAEFVNAVAVESGHPLWQLNTRGTIPGGTVLVVEGEYTNQRELHESLVGRNRAEGNENIDMLYCVSRDMVDVIGDDKSAFPALRFQEWGYDVWDGTSKDVRDGFPVSNGQLRLVQYESCRGLEGWTVVAMGLNRFLAAKHRGYEGPDADLNAFRWLMIPLTRAISHLVVTIDPGDSSARDLLRNVRHQLPGIVEWRTAG